MEFSERFDTYSNILWIHIRDRHFREINGPVYQIVPEFGEGWMRFVGPIRTDYGARSRSVHVDVIELEEKREFSTFIRPFPSPNTFGMRINIMLRETVKCV